MLGWYLEFAAEQGLIVYPANITLPLDYVHPFPRPSFRIGSQSHGLGAAITRLGLATSGPGIGCRVRLLNHL